MLRKILDDFGIISGLICNYEKTVVMPIGDTSVVPKDLSGFTLASSVKLLGMDISNNLDNVDDIFISIGEKILNLILFWSRFRLSLPGRIAILKTLLIPQLNYLGCILSPSRLVLDNLQELVDEFTVSGLRISKARYYLPPSEGGVGLIHIGTFLMAQKCSWVKRVHSKTIDNWRVKLKLGCPDFNVEYLRKVDFCPLRNPILHGIAEAFELFVNCFTEIGNNYKVVPIFNNRSFCRSKADHRLLDEEFFGKAFYKENRNSIRKLTYSDCFIDDRFRTIAQFEQMNLHFTWNTWMRLQSSLMLARKNFETRMPSRNSKQHRNR